MTRAPREFYARDTIDVAHDLLGCIIEHRTGDGVVRRARIVETEAYLGVEDPACHSYNHRRTPRVESMYGMPGLAYVYLIYGMYYCVNVVTASASVAEAVLLRAAEPIDGFESDDHRLASGPGKLCRALDITRAHDGIDLVTSDTLFITLGDATARAIISGPRVGLGGEHDAIHWPLRFGLEGSPALSRPRFPDPDLDMPGVSLRLKVPKEVRDEDL